MHNESLCLTTGCLITGLTVDLIQFQAWVTEWCMETIPVRLDGDNLIFTEKKLIKELLIAALKSKMHVLVS